MHLVGNREGLLPECSTGYFELRRMKLKHTWQLTACLLQIINSSLPTGSTISITMVVKWSHVRTVGAMPKRHSCHDYSVKLSLCICSHTESSWLSLVKIHQHNLLVCDKSCFVHSKSVCCSLRLAPR